MRTVRGKNHPDFCFHRGGRNYYWDDCPDCGQALPRPNVYLGMRCWECRGPAMETHGEAQRTAEHRAWGAMRSRCNNPKVERYPIYGGRGIKVCSRWDSYQAFLEDMGRRPPNPPDWDSRIPYYSLDRIDPDGNYEPSNCRWATAKQQANNRRAA